MIYGCELVRVYVYMRIWFKSYGAESCLCVRVCMFNALYGTSFLFPVCLSGFLGQRQLNFSFSFSFFFHFTGIVQWKPRASANSAVPKIKVDALLLETVISSV